MSFVFMALSEVLLQYALLAFTAHLFWVAILRPFVFKSPLDNIPGPPPPSLVSGNLQQYLHRHCFAFRDELARKYGRITLIRGLFGQPWLQVYDPKALHAIFVKGADAFEEPVASFRVTLGPGLLGTIGEQHRRQRKMLNPVFSNKHLREMTPLIYQVIHKMRDAIKSRINVVNTKEGVEIDMLSWMGRTTLEILGQAGLGYSFDAFTEDRPDEFASAVKAFFPQLVKSIFIRLMLPFASKLGTPAFRRRVVEMIPNADVQRLREISDILHKRSVIIFNEKKAALEKGDEALKHQIGEGRDIMSILLRENMKASEQDKLPDDELIGQISTMVLAGMDTTANSLARVLELLAKNPDAQKRLREEIMQAVETEGVGDTLDFDKLMELPYMEAVCRETFRVSPGVSLVFQEVVKDTVLPLSEPIRLRDESMTSAIPVPKGTRIVANIVSINRDPALWGPDADVWRPSRWLEPLPREVEDARIPGVYSHLMTFTSGRRACIGFKLAQVELKTVLFTLLQHFKFEPTDKTITWNYAVVQYPTVGPDSPNPELPLKVSLLPP